jgi:predicted O-linked N-acetylglucosamine transferase (SPINDLY family)
MNENISFLYDKNIGMKDISDIIERDYKNNIFFNIILEINESNIHILDNNFTTFNNYEDSIKIKYRLTIFIKNEIDILLNTKLQKLKKNKINHTIVILNNKHQIKNILDNIVLWFEKVVLLYNYSNFSFNFMNELDKYKIIITENLIVVPAYIFVEIPFYYKNKIEYDDKINFNKILINYLKSFYYDNIYFSNFDNKRINKKFFCNKPLFSIIQGKLFQIKDYEKLIEYINENSEITLSEDNYKNLMIKKITCYILIGKEETLNINIINILNSIKDIKLLKTIFILINNTNFTEIKKNLIVKLLCLSDTNTDDYFLYLIKSLQYVQPIHNLKNIFESIIKNSNSIKMKIKPDKLLLLLINQLISNHNNPILIDQFNLISDNLFNIINVQDFDSILKKGDNHIIVNFLLLIANTFDLYYKSYNDFLVAREQIKDNLEYLKTRITINIELDQIMMFNVGNFNLSYQGISSIDIFKLKSEINRKLCPGLNEKFKIKEYKNISNKIKILFHGSQLTRRHSVYKDRHQIIKGLSENNKFDVYYSTFDDIHLDVKFTFGKAKHIKLTRKLSEIKEKLLIEQFDIIVYCEIGMDPTSYYMAHLRLAKIQINTWGHSDTSGINTIDYFISSKLYELPYEEAQNHYSEKLILLDSLCTVYENPLIRYENISFKNRYHFGFTNDTVIYFCVQSLFKFNPLFDEYIFEILNKIPNSILLLLENPDKYKFIERFEGMNISHKFRFFPLQSHFDYLNLINISDIILDIHPFGGCNSSFEGFSLGKVIITEPSKMINGRFTSGFYKKMGLENIICQNKKEYINLAIKLGTDKKYREKLEEQIKNKKDILFNNKESLNEWENTLLKLIFI